MASAFGHIAVAYAMGKTMKSVWGTTRFWIFTVVCCLVPDVDVVGLLMGIPYEHVWGHRGMTHSIMFAVLLGTVAAKITLSHISVWTKPYAVLAVYFGLVTMSHALLDALTDGGLGIAFFAPFDDTRYFFPWRPIRVSPIGAAEFFSSWGLGVLISELIWIGLPVTVWLLGHRIFRRVG